MYRPLLLLATILAGVIASAPRSVSASCGDWLVHSQDSSVTGHQRVDLPQAPESFPGSRPCNGPLCGQSPVVPLPVPASPPAPERTHKDLACMGDAGMRPLLMVNRWTPQACLMARNGFELEIERPPCC